MVVYSKLELHTDICDVPIRVKLRVQESKSSTKLTCKFSDVGECMQKQIWQKLFTERASYKQVKQEGKDLATENVKFEKIECRKHKNAKMVKHGFTSDKYDISELVEISCKFAVMLARTIHEDCNGKDSKYMRGMSEEETMHELEEQFIESITDGSGFTVKEDNRT